jgi:hypothetical protein
MRGEETAEEPEKWQGSRTRIGRMIRGTRDEKRNKNDAKRRADGGERGEGVGAGFDCPGPTCLGLAAWGYEISGGYVMMSRWWERAFGSGGHFGRGASRRNGREEYVPDKMCLSPRRAVPNEGSR